MDKTDVERLSTRTQKPSQEKCGSHVCCYSMIAVLCLIFSSAALILSIITFHEVKHGHNRLGEGVVLSGSHKQGDVEFDWPRQDEVLSQLEMQFESEGIMSFSRGHKINKTTNIGTRVKRAKKDSDHSAKLNDLCNSTSKSGNHSGLKPLAHIVPIEDSEPYRAPINTDRFARAALYIPVMKQWTCSRPHDVTRPVPYGIITGGMVFNRTSGFLRLPKDGVYYIYSHVLFQLENSSEAHRVSVRMVACIPELDCELAQPKTSQEFSESNGVAVQYKNKLIGDDGIYQGGLYHFSAGTEVSMLVINPKGRVRRWERDQEDKLFISRAKENSYFGAFLVEELVFNAK